MSALKRGKRSLIRSVVRRTSTPPSARPIAIWLRSSAIAQLVIVGSAPSPPPLAPPPAVAAPSDDDDEVVDLLNTLRLRAQE